MDFLKILGTLGIFQTIGNMKNILIFIKMFPIHTYQNLVNSFGQMFEPTRNLNVENDYNARFYIFTHLETYKKYK